MIKDCVHTFKILEIKADKECSVCGGESANHWCCERCEFCEFYTVFKERVHSTLFFTRHRATHIAL